MKKTNKNIKKKISVTKQVFSEKNQKEVLRLIVEAEKYHEGKQLIQANYLYQQVLQLQPENIVALNSLGMIAMDAGMISVAMELFNFALAIAPKNISLNKNLALVYSRLADFSKATKIYIEILDRDNKDGDVHGELARLYLQTGNMVLALKHYHLAFEINPADPRNFHGLVQLDAEAITQQDINVIEALLSKQTLPLEDRRSFYFALGAIYNASERYDEAFANYAVANISNSLKFDSDKHVKYISDVINTFTPELFQQFNKLELCQSAQPVFIIGMPRSGTTLVEQILAGHSDVYAGGELNLISDIAKKLKLTLEQTDKSYMSFEYNAAESLFGFARYYLNDINNLALNNKRKNSLIITDKMPTNFIYLGLIALLFPNARVIHCRRNPLDVSLSCYFHNFAGDHGYACDLKDIGIYYQQYERLMAHWKKVLPLEIHTVEYEDMANLSELNSKKLIEFIGLDWQPGCAERYRTEPRINNTSIVELEDDMCQPTIERWSYYDKYLGTLKKTLNPWDSDDACDKGVIIQ